MVGAKVAELVRHARVSSAQMETLQSQLDVLRGQVGSDEERARDLQTALTAQQQVRVAKRLMVVWSSDN